MLRENIRLIGFGKLVGGSAAFAIGFWIVMFYGDDVRTYRGPVSLAIAASLPGVFALIGMVELCTGAKVSKISERWDEMPALLQWLLGILIVALAIGITVGVFLALAYLRII